MDDNTVDREGEERTRTNALSKRLEAGGWGLFFIWIGVSLLLDIGWGVGLIGVAVITLGGQVARKLFGLPVEGFWVICGLFFLAGGIWELFKVEVSLVPVLIIFAGVALLVSLALSTRGGAE